MRKLLMVVLMVLVWMPAAFAQSELQAKADSLRATLGAQVGQERSAAGGGRVRDFANGALYWSRDTGAHAVTGRALAKYKELGAEGGSLGYPVTDERPMTGGRQQTFQHGFIATTAAGESRVRVLSSATFTANAVVFSDPGIRIDISPTAPDVLAVTDPKLPQPANVSCGCASKDVIGTCKITIRNKGKSATCKGACNCMFEMSEDTFK